MAALDDPAGRAGKAAADRTSVRWTARVLSGGTLVSIGCLLVGFVLGLFGRDATADDPRRIGAVLGAALELRPWGWSMIGVLALLLTPPAGLVASALEMRQQQPRGALLALVVLAILVTAAVFALSG